MSPLCRITKVFITDTNQILTAECVFDWRNVLELEDDGGAKWEYDKPRTYITTNYGGFYAIGPLQEFVTKMQAWEAYDATNMRMLFSNN